MRKIILNILFVSLVMDASGLSPQASAWWRRGPVIHERVFVEPRERVVVPGAIPLSKRIYNCRHRVPITITNAERAGWVNACINYRVHPAW